MIIQKFPTFCLKLAIPALALVAAVPARAVSVTFTTTGSFTCSACTGSGTNVATYGTGADTLTLAFQGINNKTVTLGKNNTSNASAGTITASVGASGNGADITPSTFTLKIQQFSPTAGVGTMSGDVTGSIAVDSSNGAVEFSSTSVVLGGVKYTLQQEAEDINGVPGYDLEPPDTNNGRTTLQMKIQATPVPEPTFLTLTGFGFVGLSALAFYRRCKNV